MRALHLTRGENSQHGPQGVGDGPGLRECVVPQEHTDAIGVGSAGIAGDGIKLGAGILMAVEAGFEHRLHGAHTQITQQGSIVHPVEAGAGFAAVDGFSASGQDERIPFTPVKNLTTGFGLSMASGDEEQLTGRIRMGAKGPLIQPNEIAAKRWTGGWALSVQIGT